MLSPWRVSSSTTLNRFGPLFRTVFVSGAPPVASTAFFICTQEPHVDLTLSNTIPLLYFRSLIITVRNNQEIFIQNRQYYGDDMVMTTRGRIDLRVPLLNSTFYEKGPYYKALMAYRMLPNKMNRWMEDVFIPFVLIWCNIIFYIVW